MTKDYDSRRSDERNDASGDEHREGEERGALPVKLAGGLPDVPAFLHATDAEIRDAYRSDLKLIATVLKFANEAIHLYPVGSPQWLDGAQKIDDVRAATDIHGWTGARRARMFLLSAVDDAAFHAQRREQHADELRTIHTLHERKALSEEERASFAAAARVLVENNFRSYDLEVPFRDVAGIGPDDDLTLFAAFVFRRRCPQFARALATSEAVAALSIALQAWPRPAGRRRKTDTTPPKWEAVDALMKASGLVGCTPDGLEADWKAWLARGNK